MKWILMILLLFGSANVFWTNNQRPASVLSTAHLSTLERGLMALQEEIEKAENVLHPLASRLHKHREETAALAIEIKSIESAYTAEKRSFRLDEAYAVKVDQYNGLAEEYSSTFIKYQTLYSDYIVKLSRYNSLAEEGMNLAQKHNQTWTFTPRGRAFLLGPVDSSE
jgi:hypothetical protein